MTAQAELTEADAVRDHVRVLRAGGASYDAIADAAGLGQMTVWDLVNGSGRVTPVTAAALLAVEPGDLAVRLLDAGGTRLRLRSLVAMGHTSVRISRAMGVHPETVRHLIGGRTVTVAPEVHQAAVWVFEQWWDKAPPERTPCERRAASGARLRAARGNWCTAAGMDDESLDIPGYKPPCGWRPATGTGIAVDLPRDFFGGR
jgi:DNA-binding CsgD family transcriptional regulator